jgi:hypothetical protein
MSLYHQQPSMAGPSSYAAASAAYAQRAPPPVSYHQPHAYPAQPPVPPQPIYHMDPSHFRRDLQGRLEHLTDNNRDIIGSILTFVQQYPRWVDIVGQCLEAHIRRVSSSPPYIASHLSSVCCVLGMTHTHTMGLNYYMVVCLGVRVSCSIHTWSACVRTPSTSRRARFGLVHNLVVVVVPENAER